MAPVSTGGHVRQSEGFVVRKMRRDLAGDKITSSQWTLVVEEDSTGDSDAMSFTVNPADMMRSELCTSIWRARGERALFIKTDSAAKHFRSRCLINRSLSTSYHFKKSKHSPGINVVRIDRAAKRFSNVCLGSKVVDFIRLYSFDCSSDAFIFQ